MKTNRPLRNIYWPCALFIVLLLVISANCQRRHVMPNATLLLADSALVADADSQAFGIICSVDDSLALTFTSSDSALFAVLANQSLDRMGYDVDDSLAQRAVDYYPYEIL